MLTIAPLTLPEVRQEWGWLRNGLLEVIGRCKERYEPEDVWTAIFAANAYAWRIMVKGDDIGFLILRREVDLDGPALFIWCCWTEPNALVEWQRDLILRLDELAQRMGARRIRMESSRSGWRGLDYFDPVRTIFEREV